ncbi:MAG: SpoIIE family protein phosphatase [Planctomycetota bacterium]|nr:SpoIIE family protein phosphatase [Planctomycetota bacterium]MDA1180331.1 SpoIIE family protein phosphatase [Planctomycetota bacterium]
MTVASRPYLQCEGGPQAGQKFPLAGDEAVIGRHPDCQILLDLGAVSRQHARIIHRQGQYFLEDLDSRNGTVLNETPLPANVPTALNQGDRIHICGAALHFSFPNLLGTVHGLLGASQPPRVLFDDGDGDLTGDGVHSGIMSKLDVSRTDGALRLSASPEVKLNAMLEIMRCLSGSLSLDQVLPQVLDALFKIFLQADRGFIVLKEPDGKLVPRWTKFRHDDGRENIRISRTIVNHVIQSQEAILSKDAASDERFDMSQSVSDFQIRSMICAPMIDAEGVAIGALQIDTLDQRQKFRDGDLEVLASVASQAAIAINNARLYEQVLAQREMQRDLELAREVQQKFLPSQFPQVDGYNFYHFYRPANHVGGDYFDYITLSNGKLAIIVADVVGHGMAAALMMARLSAEARTSLMTVTSPADALTRLNRVLSDDNMEDRFVTLVLVVLDPQTRTITVANAGHMAPVVCGLNRTITRIGEQASGVPLMIINDFEFEQAEYLLQPGDLMLLHTDGINEAPNTDGVPFGLLRLSALLQAHAGHSAEHVGGEMMRQVEEHVRTCPQEDDMCLVVLAVET